MSSEAVKNALRNLRIVIEKNAEGLYTLEVKQNKTWAVIGTFKKLKEATTALKEYRKC